jgi:predicted transposase YbfD/YdcC
LSKKTVTAIIDSGNDYLIGVKKNQPNLYKQIEACMSNQTNWDSLYSYTEQNRGRIENRTIVVSNKINDVDQQWKGLRQIISIERLVKRKGKLTKEKDYFISSQNENAMYYDEGIRSHWQIENSLHWVKDVTLKEDASKIKMGNAPQNISTLKNISINIMRTNNYNNLAQGIRMVSNKIDTIWNMIF